jgi:hypothetical protein
VDNYWKTQLENARFSERMWLDIASQDREDLTPEYANGRSQQSAEYAKKIETEHG